MVDIICKMQLDERHANESLVYDGRRYYSCSVGCRAEFERHPEDYAQPAQSENTGESDV
jgi:YHS domain-containing protein